MLFRSIAPHESEPLRQKQQRQSNERRIVLGRIIVGSNGQTVAECELSPGRFIMGRTVDNDLQIDSKFISRHHAQIVTTHNISVIEDLNSTNGIHVRGKRVRRRILNDGDVVHIGQHEIMYFDERQARTRVPAADGDDDSVIMPGRADRTEYTPSPDMDLEDEDDAFEDDINSLQAKRNS